MRGSPNAIARRNHAALLDDATMAALSGASGHYAVAHVRDCDCRRGCAHSIVGRVGRLARGRALTALAYIGGPLGGNMVPQLAAPPTSRRCWRAAGGSHFGVVVGGTVLAIGMVLTSMGVTRFRPWPAWWIGGVAFIGVELVAHFVLSLRGRPSFYNGRG
jgi:hypothetical protein